MSFEKVVWKCIAKLLFVSYDIFDLFISLCKYLVLEINSVWNFKIKQKNTLKHTGAVM